MGPFSRLRIATTPFTGGAVFPPEPRSRGQPARQPPFADGWLKNAGIFAAIVHGGQTASENPPSTLTPLGVSQQVGFYFAPVRVVAGTAIGSI
jgi:hypothetical protein